MKTTIKRFMSCLIFLTAFVLSVNPCFAQNSKKHVYKVWVKKLNTGQLISGYLYQITSEELFISSSEEDVNENELITVYPNEISFLKVKRKGKGGQGALIGASIGVGVGAIIGFASSDDRDKIILPLSKGDKALIMGTTLGALGAITGAIINTKKAKYIIDGDAKKFQDVSKMLQGYQLIVKSTIKN